VITKVAISAVYKQNTSKKHIELSSSVKVDSVFNMPSMINQKAVVKNIKQTDIRIATFASFLQFYIFFTQKIVTNSKLKFIK